MKKIDFHAHYLTPSYREFVKRKFCSDLPEWNMDIQFAMNRDNDIAYSLMGISMPYFDSQDIDETYSAVMKSNDEIAQMVSPYPKQMGFLAALPIPDSRLSLLEIDRAMGMGAKGFTFDTNMNGVYLGDPLLDPVMKRLDELHAFAIFHPTKPTAVPAGVLDNFRVQALEFFYDTTRTFVNMSRNLVFSRYPDIRWVIPHAGALIPAISDRVQSSFRMEGKGADLFSDLEHIHIDLAGPVEPRLLNILKSVAPIEHMVYGTDFPYATAKDVEKYRGILEKTDKLSEAEKEKVFYQNGAKLLEL